MHVVQVNYAWERSLRDPDALLDAYPTLTGWSEALVAAGARVTVVQRFGEDHGIHRGGVAYAFRRFAGLNRAAVDRHADVVHVHGLVFPLATWHLRRRLAPHVPIVIQDHATGDPSRAGRRAFVRRFVRRRGLAAADAFFFAAAEQADPWRREGLISQAVYEVMESAPTLSRMARDAARQVSGMTGAPALLWVGRLNANKDPLSVLAGFARALPHMPDATLTMVYGEDDLLPMVLARIRGSADLRDRVRLVARVPHHTLAAYYSAADLFVIGSHHEGSGYALLEACACGAVPVVTDIPSFRAITGNGAVGALWPPGDAAACARALVEIASHDLAAMSARTVAHVERAFSWPAIAARAIAGYAEVRRRRVGTVM